MADFWQWYASVSDDIRHKVIEEGWFGRQVTPDITSQDMPALAADAGPSSQAAAQDITAEDLYGEAARLELETQLEEPEQAEPDHETEL